MRNIALALCFAALAIPALAAEPAADDAPSDTRPSSANNPATAPSPDSIRDLKTAADAAQKALDQAKAAVIAKLQQNADYQQANSDLLAAQTALNNTAPDDPDRPTAAANKLTTQIHLDNLQNDAFSNDPATIAATRQARDASANYQAAEKQFQADQAVYRKKLAAESTFENRLAVQFGNPRDLTAPQHAKLAQARGIDSKIDAYGKAHNLPPDMIAAMHEGRASIGLPEDALPIFMHVKLSTAAPATPGTKQYIASSLDYHPLRSATQIPASIFSDDPNAGSAPIPDDTLMPWHITVKDGKVTEIVNP